MKDVDSDLTVVSVLDQSWPVVAETPRVAVIPQNAAETEADTVALTLRDLFISLENVLPDKLVLYNHEMNLCLPTVFS